MYLSSDMYLNAHLVLFKRNPHFWSNIINFSLNVLFIARSIFLIGQFFPSSFSHISVNELIIILPESSFFIEISFNTIPSNSSISFICFFSAAYSSFFSSLIFSAMPSIASFTFFNCSEAILLFSSIFLIQTKSFLQSP